MTPDEKEGLSSIQGTLGFRVIETMCKKRIDELDKCSTLDETTPIEQQALGRKYAVRLLKELLSDIGLSIKPTKSDNTYE